MVPCGNQSLANSALWFVLGALVSQAVGKLWKLLWKRKSS